MNVIALAVGTWLVLTSVANLINVALQEDNGRFTKREEAALVVMNTLTAMFGLDLLRQWLILSAGK